MCSGHWSRVSSDWGREERGVSSVLRAGCVVLWRVDDLAIIFHYHTPSFPSPSRLHGRQADCDFTESYSRQIQYFTGGGVRTAWLPQQGSFTFERKWGSFDEWSRENYWFITTEDVPNSLNPNGNKTFSNNASDYWSLMERWFQKELLWNINIAQIWHMAIHGMPVNIPYYSVINFSTTCKIKLLCSKQ